LRALWRFTTFAVSWGDYGVQTTLLSAGIAIILALVAALVGPLFVDWSSQRALFEEEVGKLTGLEVRVTGPIDVRLLPTPTLNLQDIEVGRPGDQAKTRARGLRIEFALGDLMRGTWRASDMVLQGPELTLGLDPSGRLAWSTPTIGLDPDSVAIEHLEIEWGRATFADAASGARLTLDQLEFTGQVRSLLGPVKGEGSFVLDGRTYPFQFSAGRPADDGGVKVRLSLAPIDHPRSLDIDGSIWIEHGLPRFDGTLQMARPVGRGPDGIVQPWRISSHVHVDGAGALLQQVELQYGAEEQAIRLKGDAKLSLGAQPELTATLSGSQIDLDRIIAAPETGDHKPRLAIERLAEALVAAPRPSFPVRLGISAETVTLGGAMLQRVGGDVASNRDGWNIEDFSLRAPGLSQVAFSGQLSATRAGPSFAGAAKIESADLQALFGWLAERADMPAAAEPLRLTSDVALSNDRIAFDHLQLELDQTKVEGSLDYVWPGRDKPVTFNANLRAPALEVDRVLSLLQAGFGVKPAVDISRVGGLAAKDVAIKMRYDPTGLHIARFVGDIGGAAASVSGDFDTGEALPRGSLSLDLDASSLGGIAAVAAAFSSPLASDIRRAESRAAPLHLHSSLVLDRDGTSNKSSSGKLRLQGNAGVLRLDLQGDASGSFQSLADLTRLGGSKVHLKGSIDSSDGGALVAALGLDRLFGVNQRSGWLRFDASGPPDGDMAVTGELRAGGLEVAAKGSLHPFGEQGPTAQIALDASAAELVPMRLAMIGRAVEPPWSRLKAKLSLAADGSIGLADLDGTVAGYPIKGNLGVGLGTPMRLNGDLTLAYLDVPAAIGTAVGFPRPVGNPNGTWPADPFEAGLLSGLEGRVTISAAQAALSSTLTAHDLHAVVDVSSSALALQKIDGNLAGGHVSGDVGFGRGEDGVAVQGHVDLVDANAGALLGSGAAPLSGKLTAALDLSGSGRSPIALIGSLTGKGSLTLRDGGIARMNAAAFDMVERAVARGLPIDTARIGEQMDAALGAAALPVPLAQGAITVSMGQLRPVDITIHAANAELVPSGSIDLTQSSIDARLTLSAASGDDRDAGHPAVTVNLKGPVAAPRRTLDVGALTHWLALRAADEKAKRVDALEQAAREHPDDVGDTTGSPSPPEQDMSSTAPTLPRPSMPPRQRPAPGPDQPARRSGPAVEQAPLPPPIDIRPPVSHGPRG